MIDFLKIAIFDSALIEKIWNNPLLEYSSEKKCRISEDEVHTSKTRIYKNLIFEKHTNCLLIKGSIHYFFNDGIHNANDFSFVNSVKTLLYIAEKFNLDLTKCIIQNLEFGLNILPREDVKKIIQWTKYHYRNKFYNCTDLQYSKRSIKYSQEGKANYYKFLKIYAKGTQKFNGKTYADPNTIRIEVKSKESKYFNTFGIYTLSDLFKPEIYLLMAEELISEWNEVLVLEKSLLGEETKLKKYLNSDFWDDSLNSYRNKFAAEKKKYSDILNRYPDSIHSDIKNKLKSKLDLFAKELKSSAISTSTEPKSGAISTGLKKPEVVQFPQYIKEESAPICLVTKLDISMQKDESRFLSTNGLRWLKDNDPNQYQILRKCFLPHHGFKLHHTKYEKDEITHIAKQIRNQYHNRRRYFDRIPATQLSIFGA